MGGIDLNTLVHSGQSPHASARQNGLATGYGPHRVRAAHSSDSAAGLRAVRHPPPQPAPTPRTHQLRSVPLLGVRLAHLPGEPPRYRDVSARPPAEAVPRGAPGPGLAEHLGPRERDARPADLRRPRADLDRPGACPVRHRDLRGGPGTDGLHLRCDNDRSVPHAVPVGPLPPAQGSGEAPHPARPARPHPDVYGDHGRQVRQCDAPRPSNSECYAFRVCPFISPLRVLPFQNGVEASCNQLPLFDL